jgi:hypothetical protein
MNKALKITGITLLSLLGVILIVVAVAMWIVFTPEKLTPIVRNQLPKFITCETSLDNVDLTFFSTFPDFGLHLENVCIKNPMPESPSDTVAFIEDCTATVNLMAFLFDDKVILENFYLQHLFANLYTDSIGKSNFDIFPPSEEENDTTPFAMPFDVINLKTIKISDVTAFYADKQTKISVETHNLNLNIQGLLDNENANIKTTLESGETTFNMNDSTSISAVLKTLELNIDGDKNGNDLKGDLTLSLPDISFNMDNVDFVKSGNVTVALPFFANIDTKKLILDKAKMTLNDFAISLNGQATSKESGDIDMNLTFDSNNWNIKQLLQIVPSVYTESLKDITINGDALISGSVQGIYNDSLLPQINANLQLSQGTFAYKGLPYNFRDVNLKAAAALNLNKNEISSAIIQNLSAKTGSSSFSASGKADDILNKILCDIQLKASLNLPDVKPILPKDMHIDLKGNTVADIKAKFNLDDIANLNLKKIHANGTIDISNLDVTYDSLLAQTPSAHLTINLPSAKDSKKFKALLSAKLTTPDLKVKMIDSFDVRLQNTDLDILSSNFMDTTQMLSATCAFNIKHLAAIMDTISVDVTQPQGEITLSPSRRNPKHPRLQCNYSSQNLLADMGSTLHIDTKYIKIGVATTYDETQENLYLRFNPRLNVDFNEGNIQLAQVKPLIRIPAIKFDFSPRQLSISDSRVIIGESDFKLTGEATNIRKYIKGQDLLKGQFDFVSEKTNINQLMDLVSGFGNNDSTTVTETATTTPAEAEANPFMVPKGIDVTLHTVIKNAVFNDNLLQNVGGQLTIKDGVAVLEQMGFTCDAAKMQLTAIYRSERRNHLFAGINFHLLNIDIKQLIHMVPCIDTIVPMLKSFEGRAQFHLSAETYLKANYDLKMSTLRGAAAIEGKDLVLMDNETFGKIAKPLLFSRKTKNLVDSLSVEMTVFRNEVDLYPFIISMDNYSAVVSGRYDLSQNYNAHIETLSPIRLALQIKGNTSDFDNMKFDLVPTKYSNMYKPERRNVNQARVLELKQLISESLKRTVK